MPIDIKQLMALLQQGAPQQGAVMPPGGDPPPTANSLLNKTGSPLGVGGGSHTTSPQNQLPADLLKRGYTPMEGADPADLARAIEGVQGFHAKEQAFVRPPAMPTTQQGPKPQMRVSGGPPSNATSWMDMTGHLNDLLGKESIGDEDSALGALSNFFPGFESRGQSKGNVTMLPTPRAAGVPEELTRQGYTPMEGTDQGELSDVVSLLQGGTPHGGSLFQRLDEERGYNSEQKALMGAQGTGPIASMFTAAAEEAVQRGADTPDKADEILRVEFQEDPEIESAIAQARARYETARARSAEGPGVMEYIGYVLATLAGANPMQAAEAISRRGEKRQDEHMALQDLLGAQGMRIKDRQMRRHEAGQQGMALQRLMADQQEGAMRQQNRAEDKNFDRLKAGRGAALQRMNQLQQAIQYSTNPAEKKALQAELDNMKRRTQFFGRQLGEPEVDEQGRPMSVASPDAMRLLGLG